ncbi:hypothetical protein ACH5RR_021713 [Cinchona calisaya]|uniref:Uncharacterized protein n=1 Tax=Cinchona calisaya TaxID=153742 RepID=A0ABD2ZJ25_9GENT
MFKIFAFKDEVVDNIKSCEPLVKRLLGILMKRLNVTEIDEAKPSLLIGSLGNFLSGLRASVPTPSTASSTSLEHSKATQPSIFILMDIEVSRGEKVYTMEEERISARNQDLPWTTQELANSVILSRDKDYTEHLASQKRYDETYISTMNMFNLLMVRNIREGHTAEVERLQGEIKHWKFKNETRTQALIAEAIKAKDLEC